MVNLSATAPIKIPHNCLLSIFNLPPIQDWENFTEAESEHQIKINFFLMVSEKNNGKDEWRGEKSQNVPSSCEYDWEPKAIINIAVKSWPADFIWWLPSQHLIRQKYFCTRHPEKCQYSFLL